MDAIHGRAEIQSTGAERIARAAGHEAGQIRLSLDHLRRWRPVRPFRLARNLQQTLPLEAVSSDPDAVTQCAAVSLYDVEMALRSLDDNGAGCLGGAIKHHLALELRLQLHRIAGNKPWLIADIGLLGEALRGKHQARRDHEPNNGQAAKCDHQKRSCLTVQQLSIAICQIMETIKSRHRRHDTHPARRWSPGCCIVWSFFEDAIRRVTSLPQSRGLSFRRDPQPQSIGDDRYRADAADPQGHEPQQPMRKWSRIFPRRRPWEPPRT